MLQQLTERALARGWPPQVYARLCGQLRDVDNEIESADVLDILLRFVHSPSRHLAASIPLFFEYVAALAADPRSILPYASLLIALSRNDHNWESRTSLMKSLINFVAQSCGQWRLDFDRARDIGESLSTLTLQATQGSQESSFLVAELIRSKFVEELARQLPPEWLERLRKEADSVPRLKRALTINSPQVVTDDHDSSSSEPKNALLSNRVLRLAWLDWAVRTAAAPDMTSVRRQLEILWPDERPQVVAFELSLNAFDCYAAAPKESKPLWSFWIIRKLPLILRDILECSGERLDPALVRVFTAMDKELIAAAEEEEDLLVRLGQTLVDLGVCDAGILRTLHRNYEGHPEPAYDPKPQPSLVTDLPRLGPIAQAAAASAVLRLTRTRRTAVSTIAAICSNLVCDQAALWALSVHVSMQAVVEGVLVHADRVSMQEGAGGSAYSEFGAMFTFVSVAISRFNIPSAQLTGFTATLWSNLGGKSRWGAAPSAELDWEQTGLLGKWISGLFGSVAPASVSGGLTDDLLRPPQVLFPEVLPALVRQSAQAYHAGVMPRELLESGLDYFVQPFLVPCLGIIFAVLRDDIQRCVPYSSAASEIIEILLSGLLARRTEPPYIVAAAGIMPTLQKLGLTEDIGRLNMPNFEPLPTKIVGSATDFLASAVNAAVVWNKQLSGIAPMVYDSVAAAKAVLGPKTTLQVIESKAGESANVVVGLLVIDAVAAAESEPLLATGENTLSKRALDIAGLLKEVVESAEISEIEAAAENEEVILDSAQDDAVSGDGLDIPAEMTSTEKPSTSNTSELLDIAQGEDDNAANVLDDFNFEMEMDAPMDLAALDSAMELGWD